jgi:membrane-associated phospholipid phosphatase
MLRVFLVLVALAVGNAPAWAEQGAVSEPTETKEQSEIDQAPSTGVERPRFVPRLRASYLVDGGAIPFIYGSTAVGLGFRFLVKPPNTPHLFPPSEGGVDNFDNTVPEVVLGAISVGGAALIGASGSASRWYHLKGYGQALLTTMAATEISKNLIGRRRPHFQPGDFSDDDHRRSFFSGHSSAAAATAVYLGLYLNEHVAPRLRGAGGGFLKLAGASVLAAILVGVPASRIDDNKHHLSDVLTGAAVGSAFAVVFYAYQEGRYRTHRERFFQDWRSKGTRVHVVPDIKNRGLSLVTSW